jgi:hypothetical protein
MGLGWAGVCRAGLSCLDPLEALAQRLLDSHPADQFESVCDRLQSSASSSQNWEQAVCQPSSGWLRGDRDVWAGDGPSITSAS